MSDRIFTIVLSLSLTLQNVCTGFQVWTFLQFNFQHNSVNIICQHNASENWTMGATVLINGKNVGNTEQANACQEEKEGKHFICPFNITDENKQFLYHCMVYRQDPLPIQTREGKEISLLPGCAIPPPTPTNTCKSMGNDCPHFALPTLLFWALPGVVSLLGLYSLIITVFYITLRRKFAKELSVTYVTMQKNQVRAMKKVKGHGTDKNAEYMDMREVHHHAQPIRDMNHNSHPNPNAFSV